jgi:hypothetical protein
MSSCDAQIDVTDGVLALGALRRPTLALIAGASMKADTFRRPEHSLRETAY